MIWVKFLACDSTDSTESSPAVQAGGVGRSFVCYPALAGARCHLAGTMTKIANYWQTGGLEHNKGHQKQSRPMQFVGIALRHLHTTPLPSPLSSVVITSHSRHCFVNFMICINNISHSPDHSTTITPSLHPLVNYSSHPTFTSLTTYWQHTVR